MTTLLRSEFIKLRTTRTFVALTAVAGGLSLLVTVLTGVLSDPQPQDVVVEIFANDFSSAFILILAIIGITGEWRHRTITGALLAAPDRLRFLAAKAVAFAGAGRVFLLLISAAVTVVGLGFVGVRDLSGPDVGELVEYVTRSAGLAALVGAFGVALGALVRNQGRGDRGRAGGDLRPGADAARDRSWRWAGSAPSSRSRQRRRASRPGAVGLEEANLLNPQLATLALLAWIGIAFPAGVDRRAAATSRVIAARDDEALPGHDQVRVAAADALGVELPQALDRAGDLLRRRAGAEQVLGDRPERLARATTCTFVEAASRGAGASAGAAAGTASTTTGSAGGTGTGSMTVAGGCRTATGGAASLRSGTVIAGCSARGGGPAHRPALPAGR